MARQVHAIIDVRRVRVERALGAARQRYYRTVAPASKALGAPGPQVKVPQPVVALSVL